ncbi:MAG: CinA family nicotinamide mononucleotide deamidase-related protein [Desulfobacterales bacterium]|jgi:nicotinamide-nucleotide amidase
MKKNAEGLTAEILATGDELRTGAAVDTNSSAIASELERIGITVVRHSLIGDDEKGLVAAFKEIADRASVAIVTGGLGPTDDDRTAQAAAMASGKPLVEDVLAAEQIERFLGQHGIPASPGNLKQAWIPEGASLLPNPVGSAPGFCLDIGHCRFFFLPGVPREMAVVLKRHVLPHLIGMTGGAIAHDPIRVISTYGLTESAVGERLHSLEGRFPRLRLGLRLRFPEIDIRLYPYPGGARSVPQGLDNAADWIQAQLGTRVVSKKGLSMQAEVGRLLSEQEKSLAVAESCTGGLVAALLTEVPGSSAFFLLSSVTYSNSAKIRALGVSPATLDRYGAVHEETAKEMADGARRLVDADVAISTTGIAGPDGGSEAKPVGTVCIGLAARDRQTEAFRYRFSFDDRRLNRRIFAITALDRLRVRLIA